MRKKQFLKTWKIPIYIGLLTLISLIWALAKNGIVDIISCLFLMIPILIILKYYYLKK